MSNSFRKLPLSLGEHEIVRRGAITLTPTTVKTSGVASTSGGDDETSSKLPTPDGLAVESQTLHIGRHGEQFVDVVVCWNHVDGAEEYNIRIRSVDE